MSVPNALNKRIFSRVVNGEWSTFDLEYINYCAEVLFTRRFLQGFGLLAVNKLKLKGSLKLNTQRSFDK